MTSRKFPTAARNTCTCWSKPVSYTHLDVYKRQQLDWSISRLRPNSVSLGSTDTQKLFTPQSPQPSQTRVSVSYTHLDVYKRQDTWFMDWTRA